MQEIRTSGSMSGDGKRSVAAWPKLPRPSSTLPKEPSWSALGWSAYRGAADYDAGALSSPEPQLLTLNRHARLGIFAAQIAALLPISLDAISCFDGLS